jgi:hypothetical protein
MHCVKVCTTAQSTVDPSAQPGPRIVDPAHGISRQKIIQENNVIQFGFAKKRLQYL